MPALKGRRLTVFDIVTKIAVENSLSIALEDYEISRQDASEVVDYCINLRCKYDMDRLHYCDGCILRTFEEGHNFKSRDYIEVKRDGQIFTVSLDGNSIFFGTLTEMEDSEFGKVTWLMAGELKLRYEL